MSKRPISFGNAGLGSKPNPFTRPSKPAPAKSSLGFDNDEDDQDEESNRVPPKRKQLRLDDELEDEDDNAAAKSKETPSAGSTPFFMRKTVGRAEDQEDDVFSRLKSKKGKGFEHIRSFYVDLLLTTS